MHFMNLAENYCTDNSEFQILPIEYEGNVSYGKGASKGPNEIIKASEQLEYYDEQFDCEPFVKGIKTINKIEDIKNKFTVALGGDHSVTIDVIKELEKENDFSVIILDAHPDMFYSWNGSQHNHRCVAQKTSEKHETLIVGVRSMDVDEKELIEKKENVSIIKSYEYDHETLKKELKKLKKSVYLSIDVDVFDPSFIRNTGTPEPGGFSWNEVINILKTVFREKNIISADIVEFAPNQNFESEAYSLAKLAYKLFSLKQKLKSNP
ncbi:agmatinase [Candidatus Woesearchaeota archaeon]|nr:agmatinase [Candidatus Woesearchaeota archaeon]